MKPDLHGSFVTHVMYHRDNGQRCRVTRGFHEERLAAKKAKKAVPKIPESWWSAPSGHR